MKDTLCGGVGSYAQVSDFNHLVNQRLGAGRPGAIFIAMFYNKTQKYVDMVRCHAPHCWTGVFRGSKLKKILYFVPWLTRQVKNYVYISKKEELKNMVLVIFRIFF